MSSGSVQNFASRNTLCKAKSSLKSLTTKDLEVIFFHDKCSLTPVTNSALMDEFIRVLALANRKIRGYIDFDHMRTFIPTSTNEESIFDIDRR